MKKTFSGKNGDNHKKALSAGKFIVKHERASLAKKGK